MESLRKALLVREKITISRKISSTKREGSSTTQVTTDLQLYDFSRSGKSMIETKSPSFVFARQLGLPSRTAFTGLHFHESDFKKLPNTKYNTLMASEDKTG